jgi:hypothetical protein
MGGAAESMNTTFPFQRPQSLDYSCQLLIIIGERKTCGLLAGTVRKSHGTLPPRGRPLAETVRFCHELSTTMGYIVSG